MQLVAIVSCLLLLLFARPSHTRPPAYSGEPEPAGRALVGAGRAISPALSDNNGNELPRTTTNPPPSTYRLGTKPGGLRFITEQDKDVRIIFLFDLKPVHLFRRQFLRNRSNAIRNIITKDDA